MRPATALTTMPRHWILLGIVGTLVTAYATWAAFTFVPANTPIAYIAQPAVTANDVSGGNETIFVADYERTFWSGNLYAYRINPDGSVDKSTPRWATLGAAQALANQNWDTGRVIFTRKDGTTPVAFRWANLSGTQQKGMGSEMILKYVRGERANESPAKAKLRPRRWVLGDIVRSRPHYVPGTRPMVYVGANDGMLHAINASTGAEVWAYVPSMVIPNLGKLAPVIPTQYTHTHYVDASPASGMAGATRVLAGGLGPGGKGLWAVDITADAGGGAITEATAPAKSLWEITPATAGYADLGYTYGEVRVAKVNSGATAVISPNGYMSANGKAVLYVINATTGALVRALDTGVGSLADMNGLSSIAAVDTDGNGTVDYAYAGDLNGNLWKFDLSAAASGSWTVTKLFTTSPAQAITGAPAVAAHPDGGRMVMFGTGRALDDADLDDEEAWAIYGIRDGAPVGATAIQDQTLTVKTWGASSLVRTGTSNAMDWTTHLGWRTQLDPAERVLGDRIAVSNGRLFVHTYNPLTAHAQYGRSGENWGLQLDYLTGGGFSSPMVDMNRDGQLDDADLVSGSGSEGVPIGGTLLESGVFSQPVLLYTSAGQLRDVYAENANLPPVTLESGDAGVSGGHFDPDVYYFGSCTTGAGASCTGFQKIRHTHEYDDKYGVVGVNMLNASSAAYNLSNVVAKIGGSTKFKILVMNQYLNPAAMLDIGDAGLVSVRDYQGQASQATANFINSLPWYNPSNIETLTFQLPLDAFASKNWWGNGDIRAGLIPTQTGCVNGHAYGTTNPPAASKWNVDPGPQGERHNGALTLQLVRDATPASALEMNVAGKPEYGWRVRREDFNTYVLAEWTYFWHHFNGKCYGAAGWVKDPPQDTAATDGGTPPAGTGDPVGEFVFGTSTASVGATEISRSLTESGNTITLTVTYDDGTIVTLTMVDNGDGTWTVTESDNKGNSVSEMLDGRSTNPLLQTLGKNSTTTGILANAPSRVDAVRAGRIAWRESIRN